MTYTLAPSVTAEMLEKEGFEKSVKQIYPEVYIKQVGDKYILQVCLEKPNINWWTGDDSHQSRVLVGWKCKSIKATTDWAVNNPTRKKWLDYETERYVEIAPEHIKDLIEKGYVVNG